MRQPADELRKTAEASERLIGVAKNLLTLSAASKDPVVNETLNAQVKEIFSVVDGLNTVVHNMVAAA